MKIEDFTKTFNRRIRTKKKQFGIAKIATIISLNALDILDKCEYPTGCDIVPSGQDILIEFALSPLQQTLDKKTITIK